MFALSSIQSDIRTWVANHIDQIHCEAKEPVLAEIKMMVAVLRDAITVITPMHSISDYFSLVGIDYFKVASLTMESRVSQVEIDERTIYCWTNLYNGVL